MSTRKLPACYTPEAVKAIRDLQIWMIAKAVSMNALAMRLGIANGTFAKVMRGHYHCNPEPTLARALQAAGLPLPAGWTPAQPVDDAAPAPRLVFSGWEPGAAIAAVAPERIRILQRLHRHSSQVPLPVADLVSALGDTDAVRTALYALIATHEVMQATVTAKGKSVVVVYPVGRVPVPRPGPKAGAKPRAPSVVITPSDHAKSIHKGARA